MTTEAALEEQKRLDEEKKALESSSAKPAPSSAKEELSPEDAPKYSQNQMDKLTQMAAAKAGNKWKEVETERDTLKTTNASLTSQLGDSQADIDSIQKQLDDLSSDDPARKDLTKEQKRLRDEGRQLKLDQETLKTGNEALSVGRAEVEAMNREATIISIADELGVLDECDEVSRMCSTLGATTDEQVREVISTAFLKGEPGEKKPPIQPDSGKTKGGATYFTRAQIADRAFWEANREAILEAQAAGRIRD